jgi:hypothetical protein
MEKLVWAPARARRSLDKLRAVVVVGGQSFVLSHGLTHSNALTSDYSPGNVEIGRKQILLILN